MSASLPVPIRGPALPKPVLFHAAPQFLYPPGSYFPRVAKPHSDPPVIPNPCALFESIAERLAYVSRTCTAIVRRSPVVAARAWLEVSISHLHPILLRYDPFGPQKLATHFRPTLRCCAYLLRQ